MMAGCATGGTTGSAVNTAPVLPAEYRITYEMENGDGTISLITMAKDREGNLYYRASEEELWFLTQGNGYVEAMPDENWRTCFGFYRKDPEGAGGAGKYKCFLGVCGNLR